MTIDKLYDLRDNSILGEKDKNIIDLLLQAITDWPTQVDTVEKFIIEIKTFLKTNILNYEEINAGMKKVDPESSLWQIEALSSVLDITQTKKDATLETILYEHNIINYQG